MQALNHHMNAHAPTRDGYKRDLKRAHMHPPRDAFGRSIRREAERCDGFAGAVHDLYHDRLTSVRPALASTLKRLGLHRDPERLEQAHKMLS